MNKIARLAFSTLVATATLANVASVNAQGYPNPQQMPGGFNQNQMPNNPGNSQQFPSSNQPSFSPVGQWQCQLQQQASDYVAQLDYLLRVTPNGQFQAQGNGTAVARDGRNIPVQGSSQGSWSPSGSGILFSGQSQTIANGQSETSSFSHQYSTTNPNTISNQTNEAGSVTVRTCQRV